MARARVMDGWESGNLNDHWRRSSAGASFSMLHTIQPVVLTGGRSRRFGRDKLREPVGDGGRAWLVDRPIQALRAVFGARVAAVGECDPEVAARADFVIPDEFVGIGPVGGILSALRFSAADVFVLAGDLPWVTADSVRRIVDAAMAHPAAALILADSGRLEPCFGLYRQAMRSLVAERVRAGRHSLFDLADDSVVRVPIDVRDAVNANTPAELAIGNP